MPNPEPNPKDNCGSVCALYCSASPTHGGVTCELCPLGLLASQPTTNGTYTYSISRDCDDLSTWQKSPVPPVSLRHYKNIA